jgi:hypothetical protein
MDYSFGYAVVRLSGQVSERPINSITDAGFHTLNKAIEYAKFIHDRKFNNTYVFLDDKPVYFIPVNSSFNP